MDIPLIPFACCCMLPGTESRPAAWTAGVAAAPSVGTVTDAGKVSDWLMIG